MNKFRTIPQNVGDRIVLALPDMAHLMVALESATTKLESLRIEKTIADIALQNGAAIGKYLAPSQIYWLAACCVGRSYGSSVVEEEN